MQQKNIDTLTTEEEAQLDVYAKKYTELGLTTEPVNQELAQEICDNVYRHLLQQPAVPVTVLASPKAAWQKVCELEKVDPASCTPVWPYLSGHYDASFFAFYDYCHEVLKIEYDDIKGADGTQLYPVWRSTMNLGPMWTLEHTCVVSDRPAELRMNEHGLHCDGGMAIKYRDGFGSYSLNGCKVPEWLAVTPHHKLDPAQFATLDNVEVRQEFVRKVGMERIISHLNPVVLDKEGDYELLLVDLKGDTGKWPYLKMLNPSEGVWHLECVDRSVKTVQQAKNFRASQLALASGIDWTPSQLT